MDADTDVGAARNFIQASLKRDYATARQYMLQDSVNNSHMDAVSRMQLGADERQGLFDASIVIHDRKELNDSTSIIVYSNSFYKEKKDTLKLVKQADRWLVDFKYIFARGKDSASVPVPSNIDTISR